MAENCNISSSRAGLRLDQQVAVMAGSAIVRGIAVRFAQEGASIAIIDSDKAEADKTIAAVQGAGGRAELIGATPVDRAGAGQCIERALSLFGRIDILLAGMDSEPVWQPIADRNIGSFMQAHSSCQQALYLMQAVFPIMRDAGRGSIIALGSTHGRYTQPGIADYLAAKEALKAIVRGAAQEWGPCNIRVNLLEAAAETEAFQAYRARRGAAVVDAALAGIPIPRRGDPVKDIGGAALFLASDDSRYLTGEIIRADGGEHLAAPVWHPAPSPREAR